MHRHYHLDLALMSSLSLSLLCNSLSPQIIYSHSHHLFSSSSRQSNLGSIHYTSTNHHRKCNHLLQSCRMDRQCRRHHSCMLSRIELPALPDFPDEEGLLPSTIVTPISSVGTKNPSIKIPSLPLRSVVRSPATFTVLGSLSPVEMPTPLKPLLSAYTCPSKVMLLGLSIFIPTRALLTALALRIVIPEPLIVRIPFSALFLDTTLSMMVLSVAAKIPLCPLL